MSFSIASALALLLTLGQIFLMDGQFQKLDPRYDRDKAITQLRNACHMIMEQDVIKVMNPQQIIADQKSGTVYQQEQVEKELKGLCLKEKIDYIKTHGKGSKPPECDMDALKEKLLAEKGQSSKGALDGGLEVFKDFTMTDAIALYDYLCAPNPTDSIPEKLDLDKVLAIFNSSVDEAVNADLSKLSEPSLPQSSLIYSLDGTEELGEIYSKENRRTWVPLNQIPDVVKQAFLSAEDKNFYSHKGVELKGVLNGFLRFIEKGVVIGGSTLTQQVVKNVILSSDISLERKIKEMMIASRVEKSYSKDEILEVYLNLINLGRNSWGLQKATENYFGDKYVSDLGLKEAVFFAGITHGPNLYEPDLYMTRIQKRVPYVLKEMRENGYITKEQEESVDPTTLKFTPRKVVHSSYFHQSIQTELEERLGKDAANKGGFYLFSTQIPSMQKALEKGLQQQLYDFEEGKGRLKWKEPLGNLINRDFNDLTLEEQAIFADERQWSKRLLNFRSLYQDVQWPIAVVLNKDSDGTLMGILKLDGTTDFKNLHHSRQGWADQAYRSLKIGDVVFVDFNDNTVSLRTFPTVQAAAVVMEAKTGRVLALTGGFSFHQSELNRALHSIRQPGSTVKPFTYLSALTRGIQPDQIIANAPVYFDPIHIPGERKIRRFRKCNAWSVRNYSSGGPASMSLRRGLETSNNRVTARILKLTEPGNHELGLEYVRNIFQDFGIYDQPEDCYPIILGSQETNVVRMARAYAAIANGGTLVEPHYLDTEKNSGLIQKAPESRPIFSVDPVALFQLKNILGGVVERGTATVLKEYAGYVAGKTGTSTSYNDAWFVGFSNDIVVSVWVGYDNGNENGKKRILGGGGTGGGLAAPIAKGVFEESFKIYPKTSLLSNPPPGVRLYRENGIIESYRDGYAPGRAQEWDPRYDENLVSELEAPRLELTSPFESDPRDFNGDFNRNFDDGNDLGQPPRSLRRNEPRQSPRNTKKRKKSRAKIAIENGRGGLY